MKNKVEPRLKLIYVGRNRH